jgi:hypothetical protein
VEFLIALFSWLITLSGLKVIGYYVIWTGIVVGFLGVIYGIAEHLFRLR